MTKEIWKYPPKNSAASLGKFITICVTGCTCWLEYIELTNLLASMLKTYPAKKINSPNIMKMAGK